MDPLSSRIYTLLNESRPIREENFNTFIFFLEHFKILEQDNYYNRSSYALPYPIHFNRSQTTFIHIKRPLSKKSSSEGNFKSITLSICYQTAALVIKATSKLFEKSDQEIAKRDLNVHLALNYTDGIVPLYDYIYHTSRRKKTLKLTMMMMYYNQGDLCHYLTKTSLDLSQKLAIAKSLLTALAKLHELKYRHNDIKPENVVLNKEGETITAALIDFGLSSRFDEFVYKAGSPVFWPPEYDCKELTLIPPYAADIWEMGCVLYFLIFSCDPPWIEDANLYDSRPTGFDEPEDKSGLDHLAWQMLHPDPMKRPPASICLDWIKSATV